MSRETCSDLIPKEIKEVVRHVFHSTELCTVQVWVPWLEFFSANECIYRHEQFVKAISWTFPCHKNHSLRDQGIVGKAFATNQPWFSTDVSSIPDMDCTDVKILNLHSAIAIPLRVVNTCDIPTCRIPDKYVFEFFLLNGQDFEEQKKQIYKLISTLREFVDHNIFKFPSFQPVLQPINLVGQNGASDSLFPKENPLEASDARFLPEPRYQTEQCLDPIPSTQPAEVFDAIRETNEERHSTGDTIINAPDSSLEGAAKSTTGKTTGSAGSKRDWAWKYCSPIEGNSNGVICSFCGLEIKGGGITRFKSHLSNSDPSKNVKKCEKVPSDVKVETEKRIKRA